MAWEHRGDGTLYAERMNRSYLISRYGVTGCWVLRSRWTLVSNSPWAVMGEYSTSSEAQLAAVL